MDAAGVGPSFDLQKFFEARKVTMNIVEDLARECRPGVSEEQMHARMKVVFKERGIAKAWHPTKIRFGSNTTKSFRELSEPGTLLKESDIYYFDIGPIWDGHEGDFGRTYVVGNDPEYKRIQEASEIVFNETAAKWKSDRLSGKELYAFADGLAEKMGFSLDERMDGHRVGDFPHAIHFKKDLGDFDGVPVPNLWILEILVKDKQNRFGAFFEDLLLE